jgi:hypothetical protein
MKSTVKQREVRDLLRIEKSIPLLLDVGTDNERIEWRKPNQEIHREFGPAVVFKNGEKKWYQNGKLHRLGQPAHIKPDGSSFWFIEGSLHRDNGPAVENPNKTEYWLDGFEISQDDLERWCE